MASENEDLICSIRPKSEILGTGLSDPDCTFLVFRDLPPPRKTFRVGTIKEFKREMVLRSGPFPPDFESTRMWISSESESGNRKTTLLRHLEHSKHLVAGACFSRARPRMCRREVWVAALNLIEAHSHTLSSF